MYSRYHVLTSLKRSFNSAVHCPSLCMSQVAHMPASPGWMLGPGENLFPGICHGFYPLISNPHSEVHDKRKTGVMNETIIYLGFPRIGSLTRHSVGLALPGFFHSEMCCTAMTWRLIDQAVVVALFPLMNVLGHFDYRQDNQHRNKSTRSFPGTYLVNSSINTARDNQDLCLRVSITSPVCNGL